jgi:hypothetical protein
MAALVALLLVGSAVIVGVVLSGPDDATATNAPGERVAPYEGAVWSEEHGHWHRSQ